MKKQINIILDKLKRLDKKKVLTISIMLVCLLIVFAFPKIMLKVNESLPQVKLRNMQKNGMLAIMIPDDLGGYKEYTGIEESDTHIAQDKNSFPKGYALNLDRSFCVDKDGQKVADSISMGKVGVNIKTNKEVYCTLYYDYPSADLLIYNNIIKIPPNCTGDQCTEVSYTDCTNVQCALDELYTVIHGSLPNSVDGQ